jgi:hypothetical protein
MALVQTQLGNLGTGLTTIVTNLGATTTLLQKVPKNLAADGNAAFAYTTPISSTYSAGAVTINSIFPTVLGSSNNGGVIGTIYSIYNTLYTTLNNLKSSSTSFSSDSTISGATTAITANIASFNQTISSFDSSVASALDLMNLPQTYGTMAIQIFYAVALGLAVFTLIGVILMTFCDKYKCRYLMYFSCIILFFIGLLGFIIAVLFSIILPLMYWGCDWLQNTLGKQLFNFRKRCQLQY